MFYVYVHYRKSDNLPFYVGKGSGNRYIETRGRNRYWNKVAKKHGFYSVLWRTDLTEQEAFIQERQLIADFRSVYGKGITNISDGGEGFSDHRRVIRSQRRLEDWILTHNRLPTQYDPKEINLFNALHFYTKIGGRNYSQRIAELAASLGKRRYNAKGNKQEILEYYLKYNRWPDTDSRLGMCFSNYTNPSGCSFDPSFYAMLAETRRT